MKLSAALRETADRRWTGMRSQSRNINQGQMAVSTMRKLGVETVGQATGEKLREAAKLWADEGLSHSTILCRINCLSAMGVRVAGSGARKRATPKSLKWFLRQDVEPRLIAHLEANDCAALGRFIWWTTRTGLRVEESLRLRWDDLRLEAGAGSVRVRGTKTAISEATLPLGDKVVEQMSAWASGRDIDDQVFDVDIYSQTPIDLGYGTYRKQWRRVAIPFLRATESTATLKALRRSAARYLHVDCGMPLAVVQQYLRHEDLNTTREYLRLTGGYGEDEMRKWLR